MKLADTQDLGSCVSRLAGSSPASPTIYVYVIRSESTGILYVGITKRPARRLREHNKGQSIGTRGKGPWVKVLLEEFPSYSGAREHEKYLKSGIGREWLKNTGRGVGT